MSKTSPEELVKSVSSEMASFLKNGEINPDFIENNLEYKGIDRIQDLESILRVHFVLSDEVVDFLKKLPERVRRIKTESKKQSIRRKGDIRGRINWSRTVVEQSSQKDRSIFVCQNPSKNYNVSENLVLKKLLSVIYVVLESDLEKPLEKDYAWLKGLRKEEDKVAYLKNIYRKNVHVNRIKSPEEYEVTDRDLSIAQNSRKELYKEAAELFIRYRKLMNGEYTEEELEELLNETLILPGEAYTLFELYSIFKYLLILEEDYDIQKIEGGSSKIAVFQGDSEKVFVYHDSTGSKILNFFEDIEQLKGEKSELEFLERYRKARIEHHDLIKKLLDKEKGSFYSGRPDLLVEYYVDGNLKKLVIGEVKYSRSEQTFSKGLRELIEYLYFARKKNEYLLDIDEGRSEMKGVFFIDKKEFLGDDKLSEGNLVDCGPFELEIYDTDDLEKIGE